MTYTYPNYQPNYPTWNQPYMPPQMGVPVQQPQVPTYPAYTVANPYAGFGYGCCGTAQSCCC